jgi:kynurenine formamidase
MDDEVGSNKELAEHVWRHETNWGRWGSDDQIGAPNLITPAKRVAAAQLVRSGRSISLSRELATQPAPNNQRPAHHYVRIDGNFATDYYGLEYHGKATTHLDALCHLFDERGRAWNDRVAAEIITPVGARWGGVENWRDGIVTRGVIIDVPRYRNQPYVTKENPVTAQELEAIVDSQNIVLTPGDGLVIYSGRDNWDLENIVWGGEFGSDGRAIRPGLDPSCLEFLRKYDCALLAWDMMDALPNDSSDARPDVHSAIYSLGVALVDNCALEQLATACAHERRVDFMLVVSPLVVVGGTGSPANPLAIL